MKPALLITWPKHVDFPLFRFNLKRFSSYFGQIYIAFTNHHMGDDYSNFVRSDLPAICIDAERTSDGDWRDDAVNQLLDIMPREGRVLFLEQDFLMTEDFLKKVLKDDHDFIYYEEMGRIHPAFAVVKWEIIDKTSRDFSVHPPKDHFGRFFEEVKVYTQGENIEKYVTWKKDFYHMQGLTQNYNCFKFGDNFFRPSTFFYFNYRSSLLPNQSPFKKTMDELNQFPRPKIHEFLDNFFE